MQINDEDNYENIRLFVWDTAGQERFRHIARMYYKDIHGVLLVFDLTDEDSFKNINFWISDLHKHAPEKLVSILVGNKDDMCQMGDDNESINNERQVSYDQAQKFALDNKMYYYECSAKTGHHVKKVFEKMASEINQLQK